VRRSAADADADRGGFVIGPWVWLGGAWAVTAALFAVVWYACHRAKNAGYVDVAWACSIGVGVVIAAVMLTGEPLRLGLVAVLGAAWAWRLAWHLFKRIHGKEEDGRYAHMREHFGDKAPLAFFVFFQMQALFVVLFLAPMIAAMTRPGTLGWRDVLGVLVWVVAIVGEYIADKQLADFKRDPNETGKVCKRGLWRVSRHPNYFFEWVHWFAYLAIGVRFGESIGYAALLGPVVMGLFLIFVTGIPYTEMRAVKSKGEAYKQYQRETSAFIPWFPKKADAT
jgi:steroid 5-alpha reductase family enzyme